mmetsp:Transcript_117442/g.219609  ORF Transcript_117442/g.219609 Transcript_117442/m.219609 type:complete len:200 (-) Transcript_117442:15-614(-)
MPAAALVRSRHALPSSSLGSRSNCCLLTTCQPSLSHSDGKFAISSTPRFCGGGEAKLTTGSAVAAASTSSVSMARWGVGASAASMRTSAASSIGNIASRSLSVSLVIDASRPISSLVCSSATRSRYNFWQCCSNSSRCAGFAEGCAPRINSGTSERFTSGPFTRPLDILATAAIASSATEQLPYFGTRRVRLQGQKENR